MFLVPIVLLSNFTFELINAILSSWIMLQERLQWNGITNKKKGQKWGIEKVSSYRRNDRVSLNPDSSERLAAEEETHANSPINFDKLKPYTSLPKVYFHCNLIVFASFNLYLCFFLSPHRGIRWWQCDLYY